MWADGSWINLQVTLKLTVIYGELDDLCDLPAEGVRHAMLVVATFNGQAVRWNGQ